MTRTLTALALAWFGYRSVSVLLEHGYAGFLAHARANSATDLLLLDVTLFVVLASIWMLRDAARPWWATPFVALAAGFGAAGPLCYLLLRPWLRKRPAVVKEVGRE
ncbi:MAG: DUF2834 domain-containing protein [Vicinamibacterales bacterium]